LLPAAAIAVALGEAGHENLLCPNEQSPVQFLEWLLPLLVQVLVAGPFFGAKQK